MIYAHTGERMGSMSYARAMLILNDVVRGAKLAKMTGPERRLAERAQANECDD